MKVIFKELKLENYKSHQDLQVNFGEVTKVTGDNARGKSSILEAVSWTLYGTDTFGGKSDPTPVTYEAGETLAELLLNVDDKQLLLGRGLKKGKAQYYINEVPKKATEFNEIVDSLFDKELFLSLFNPNYFFTLHWEKQRSMVLQYVTAPSNKEVFKVLPELQASKLSELVKKHSLDDLKEIHKANKTKMEKAHIAAESRTKTLKEQLQQMGSLDFDVDEVKQELDDLRFQVSQIELIIQESAETNKLYDSKSAQVKSLQHQVEMSFERYPNLRDEVIEDTCRTCKRPLDEESVKAVEQEKENRIEQYKAEHKALVEKRKSLQEELNNLKRIDVSEQHEKIRDLMNKQQPLQENLRKNTQHEQLLSQIEQASKDEKDKLASLKESIFILDAIKDFKAKEAELQSQKVQDLFETLSIRLFTEQKNGDIKPSFEIEMDGKAYSKLSLSESIRAGLELREVLSEQSGLNTPCFVDNAESITRFKEPTGQLIMCQVVANKELQIESEGQ